MPTSGELQRRLVECGEPATQLWPSAYGRTPRRNAIRTPTPMEHDHPDTLLPRFVNIAAYWGVRLHQADSESAR